MDPVLSDPAAASAWKWRALAVSAAGAALGYWALSRWSGGEAVASAWRRLPAGAVALLLALVLLGYGLRFLRWQRYLKALGHEVPWRASLGIYLAGFALTTTPGKLGEMLRSVYLQPRGVGLAHSLAALLSERLSDLAAVAALAGMAWAVLRLDAWALAAAGLGMAVLAAACCSLRGRARPRLAHARWLRHGGPRLQAGWAAAHCCHRWPVLLPASLLGLCAWTAEAAALGVLLQGLGMELDLASAVLVYAAGMLAGALSLMPGGLGGTEATMIALLLHAGQPLAAAVAATLLFRLLTLWFAVGLGLAAVGWLSLGSGGQTAGPAPEAAARGGP